VGHPPSQYDMLFVAQKKVKVQALANFLAAHLVPESSKLHEKILDEVFESNMTLEDEVWQMFFDGASRTDPKGKIIAGVGVVFISPQNYVLPRAFSLTTPCSNNVAEYNALLISLQHAHEMGVRYLKAYGDSKLIVNQVKGEYEIRHEDLVPYYHAVIEMANSFDGFYIDHVSHFQNTKADALAALAATLALPIDTTYHLMVAARRLFCPKHVLETNKVHAILTSFEPRDWRFPIIDYALHDILSDDPKEAVSIQRRSLRFYYNPIVKILYRRSYDGILLHYLSNFEVQEVLKEAHDGICGAHQSGPKLKDGLHRLSYYWPTMIADVIKYAQRCKACQIYADFIHQPPELLHPTVTSWLFEAWRIDVDQSAPHQRKVIGSS